MAILVPLPEPFSVRQTKYVYVAWGVLVGLLVYSPLTSWIIRGVTHLLRLMLSRIASEITHQLNSITYNSSNNLTPSNGVAKPILIDTSAIIDGRLLEVAKTHFLSGLLIVPDFVLSELQSVADSSDPIKRARGRRGFEVVDDLKKIPGVKVEVWDRSIKGKGVDDKLIRLARALKGKILTVDFNLNRVATLSSVPVLNLNDLGNALKTLPVPGEKFSIKIVHLGKDKNQGVGYLADGTMIVIKDGSLNLGQTIEVEVTKILQGSAGRMIFAR